MKKRIFALVMSFCMLISMMPVSAIASDHVHDASCGYAEAKACDHTHNHECGYAEAVEGAACGHHCSDGSCAFKAAIEGTPCNHSCDYDVCGYYSAIPGTPCDKGCSENADGVIQHDNCNYSEGEPGSPCKHSHDDACGYTAAVAGTACDHSHNDACDYVAAVEGSACTHNCADGTCGYTAGSPCTYVEPEHTHSLGGWHQDGDAGHYKNCIDCPENYREETVPHSFAAACDVSCDLCGYNRGTQPSPHSFSGATCITQGICPCGEEGDIDKTNHTGGTEIRGAKDATEFEDGYTGDTYCLGCGDKLADGQSIPATHPHSYTAVVTAPTCGEQGYTTYTCSCNDSYVGDYVDALSHEWGEWTSNNNGTHTRTCTTDASHTETADCAAYSYAMVEGQTYHNILCECLDGEDLYVLGTEAHTMSEWSLDGEVERRECTAGCDYFEERSVETHTHSYTAVVTAPTCKEQGYTTYTCSCNDSYVSDYVDALGHDWGDCVSIGNGRHKLVCGNDSRHEQTTNCGGRATCHELAFCSDCKTTYGEYDQDNHSGGTEVRNAKKATETENGYTGDTYCLGCNVLISEGSIIYATGSGDDDDTHTHNYSYYKFDGTNHWKMCHCGQGQAGSVKPHSLVITGASTGHVEECTVCNYFSDVEAHVYSDDSDAYCNECGYRRHVHDQSTAATCKSPAKCSCGVTTGGKDPTNHTGGTEIRNAVEATRTEKGYTGDTYCLGCDSMIASGEEIPAKGFVAVKIEDDAIVKEVTFITAEGVELPGDAEIIVNPHTPSADNLAYVLGIDADTEYLDADDVNIQIVGGGVYTAPDGTKYSMYEIILINGEEYLITNYMGTGDVLGLMRLSDGATCGYKAAVNVLDFTGSINGTVQDYAYDKVNIGGVTYDVKLSYANAQGTIEVILYYNGSPAAKLRNYEDCYFLEGFDPETLKAQQNANDLGTVTTGENPFDGLESGKTYNVSVIGSNDISVPGAENVNGTITQTFDIPVQFVNNPNVKYVAVHVTNPYAEALEEAFNAYQSMNKKLYEAIRQYENGEISLEEFNKVKLLSSEALHEYMRLGFSYDEWEKEHAADTGTGNELGTVTIAEDGKTLTATYTVDSFSPFTVYAFTEAELPEIKEFVTQPDGTLARAVNDQPVITHTVASGENLTVIARKYGCTVDDIVALNSGLIENPSLIYSGWKLTIPAA